MVEEKHIEFLCTFTAFMTFSKGEGVVRFQQIGEVGEEQAGVSYI